MKKIFGFLKLTGMQALFFSLIALFNIITPSEWIIKSEANQFQLMVLIVSGLIFSIIFFKYTEIQDIKIHITRNSLISSAILALLLYNTNLLIGGIGENYELPQRETFSFITILLTIVLIPVLEEFVCRIILINRFRHVLHPITLILSTSLFFSILHIRDINLWASTLLYGIVMAGFYITTKNSLVLILTHVIYNSLYIIFNSALIDFNRAIYPYYMSTWHIISVIASLIVFTLYLYRCKLRFNRETTL